MDLIEYYDAHGSKITQDSERLFVEEFLYPLLGSRIGEIVPQFPFLDSTGRSRRIDFAYHGPEAKIALEVNGETYHAEGIIPNEMFDDNLFRQNEILRHEYKLARFSYSQLKAPLWRPVIQEQLRDLFGSFAPELLREYSLKPSPLQEEVLEALQFYREKRGWQKGVVVLPTGTGKTILSALDARRHGGKVLFLVHRLDILKQSIDAYKMVWPEMVSGVLTGEARERELDCDVLFASKDTLRKPNELRRFGEEWFDYIVVDEVHHGQSPTYREVLSYFKPSFMLGMTATPDRTDRRDIFELFDYNKVYEIPLYEVIERGFLVPYSYYGLTDDVDYSRIRFENQRYKVEDLERLLIIPERNEAIIREYTERGGGDKAIGFCVSIKHAERMAEVFIQQGIPAAAIHSGRDDRDELLAKFRANELHVAFTVDLFNEGVDFPNVRVLLFLRPTESKTVFLQQLGRGLRLCSGKERVTVLDFIGNYKRANQIRKYLSKGSRVTESKENGRTRRKIEYEYSTGCEVVFDPSVEEILNKQDAEELGITKTDLIEAYFALAESLGRKPTRSELDSDGEYKSALYADLFGSWLKFLREIGEYTEASYHYPQGVHLGHILSILKVFGQGSRTGTHFDDEYVHLRGGFGQGRVGTYQRQVKYKLVAAMELGILTDDRNYPAGAEYEVELTALGQELYKVLQPLLDSLSLDFERDEDGIPTTRMKNEDRFNGAISSFIERNETARNLVFKVFLGMHAVQQMLGFLYQICRKAEVAKSEIYEQFFEAPFVKQFCDREGIEKASLEAARRRCPFLVNVLEACGIVTTDNRSVVVKKMALVPWLVSPYHREDHKLSEERLNKVYAAWTQSNIRLDDEDLSIVRELFGGTFLTENYYLKDLMIIEGLEDGK